MKDEKFGWFENTGQEGQPRGYMLWILRREKRFLLPDKTIYGFQLNLEHPLTFHTPDNLRLQPDRHEDETDFGSIPYLLQVIFPKDQFPLTYFFHDSGYRHGGLWTAGPDPASRGYAGTRDVEFVFVKMTRLELDRLLKSTIRVEGGRLHERVMIYLAVRGFGGKSWRKYRQ